MNMQAAIGGRAELRRQAEICGNLGSPFVASVLAAGSRQLAHAPYTEALIAAWPGDRASAAMAMRFNGALHALARRASPPELAALYRGDHGDFDGAIAAALAKGDEFIATWMRHPTQTNEVGRAAAILSALMVVSRQVRMPFELYELGTSCGLNLNLARYAYTLGGVHAGATDSLVRIVPEWRGPQPLYAPVDVVSAYGVDLHPLDATDPDACERLLAFIWADQHERSIRLEQALELARRYPPRIEEGDALKWVGERLSAPQAAGLCRVVFHSMFKQYLGKQDQQTLTGEIVRAGEAATEDRPFACISLEWTPNRSEVQLSLTLWPKGESRILATCHPYGSWVHWR
ncbi:DUF2332 family protein [soil metagenome]